MEKYKKQILGIIQLFIVNSCQDSLQTLSKCRPIQVFLLGVMQYANQRKRIGSSQKNKKGRKKIRYGIPLCNLYCYSLYPLCYSYTIHTNQPYFSILMHHHIYCLLFKLFWGFHQFHLPWRLTFASVVNSPSKVSMSIIFAFIHKCIK